MHRIITTVLYERTAKDTGASNFFDPTHVFKTILTPLALPVNFKDVANQAHMLIRERPKPVGILLRNRGEQRS